MTDFRSVLRRFVVSAMFLDHARPIEWLSLAALGGWMQFLVSQPEQFAQPRYQAFDFMPPFAWAIAIAVVIVAQLAAMRPARYSTSIRFFAMTLATGIWAVIALSFWSGETAPLSARTNTVIALSSFVTAVYLGLKRGE